MIYLAKYSALYIYICNQITVLYIYIQANYSAIYIQANYSYIYIYLYKSKLQWFIFLSLCMEMVPQRCFLLLLTRTDMSILSWATTHKLTRSCNRDIFPIIAEFNMRASIERLCITSNLKVPTICICESTSVTSFIYLCLCPSCLFLNWISLIRNSVVVVNLMIITKSLGSRPAHLLCCGADVVAHNTGTIQCRIKRLI